MAKVTFRLQPELLAALDEVVASGIAPSKNAFVERALRREIQAVQCEARRAQWEEASRDPLFLNDLAEAADD